MIFKNKTVIVTGASRGIGKAIALAFAKAGANVVINYHKNKEKAETVAQEIGANALIVQADVSKFDDAKTLVKQTVEHFGAVDILVNNAGLTHDQLLPRMSEDDFDSVIATNLKGTWNMIKHASRPMLKARQGRIINISSIVGVIGNPAQANYAASKAGIIGLTKSLAKEFGLRRVTVNAVAPGFIETDMTENLHEEIKQYYLDQIPLKRFGGAEDVANVVLFLASEQASYITGQVLHVNGGMI